VHTTRERFMGRHPFSWVPITKTFPVPSKFPVFGVGSDTLLAEPQVLLKYSASLLQASSRSDSSAEP
jgi:hypothetical protein